MIFEISVLLYVLAGTLIGRRSWVLIPLLIGSRVKLVSFFIDNDHFKASLCICNVPASYYPFTRQVHNLECAMADVKVPVFLSVFIVLLHVLALNIK